MILLIHSNGQIFHKAYKNENELLLTATSLVEVFWEVAEKHSQELIVWRDKEVDFQLSDEVENFFSHELVMASYAVSNQFFSEWIGYIDQLPFVHPEYEVRYPTWRMSTDVGGIFGKTLLSFSDYFRNIRNFGYLINSIAKIGQQNGLFCYSEPGLTNFEQKEDLNFQSNNDQLFRFVSQHYKKERLFVLFFCLWRYEKLIPICYLISGFIRRSFFKKDISLPTISNRPESLPCNEDIDVVIPTLFRAEYVKTLLEDLSKQTKYPNQVIIIEQNPTPDSSSQLMFLNDNWPFKIVHHFIHRTGACFARNLAMKEVKSDWVLLADDDIRVPRDLLENSLKEIKKLKANCLNLNALQPGEETVFSKIKQWGAFGSASAMVESKYALRCNFSNSLELGYGEDIDFGMQLRKIGCDVIYHPNLKFIHLKADRGGFRSKGINEWNDKGLEPKPSPTMMTLIKKYYSKEMLRGYRVVLFLKFYKHQSIMNPFLYYRKMKDKWELSEELHRKLVQNKWYKMSE